MLRCDVLAVVCTQCGEKRSLENMDVLMQDSFPVTTLCPICENDAFMIHTVWCCPVCEKAVPPLTSYTGDYVHHQCPYCGESATPLITER